MKKYKELILLIALTGIPGYALSYLSYLIVFDFDNFIELEKSLTSKQKIYHFFVFWLNSINIILVYILAVLQLFFSYKLLKMCFRGFVILFKILRK